MILNVCCVLNASVFQWSREASQLCVVVVGGDGAEQDERVSLAYCRRPVFPVCFQGLSEPLSAGEHH